ncbi:phosphatase PAP2 family protein [Streptomyces crystallinus]|uniref:Phosphatidic acid phosphatase type 2/haloperoxidase domain-containing protein n=1 Tax=Streptomyces crystallinus TaxID=68191 RepID=A0ABN1FW48_9ACTN
MTRARRVGAAVCLLLFVLLTVAVAVRDGAPLPGDRASHAWALDHRPPVAQAVTRALTATGSGPLPYLLAVGAGLLAGRDPRQRLCAAAGALAVLALGQAVRYGVMKAVARPRPPLTDWATHASGYSFPSGHTTTAALTAGLLAWGVIARSRSASARLTVALILLWGAAVGLSRVYLGVHWLTDVLGGWLFAAVWLTLGTVVTAPHIPDGIRREEPVGRR